MCFLLLPFHNDYTITTSTKQALFKYRCNLLWPRSLALCPNGHSREIYYGKIREKIEFIRHRTKPLKEQEYLSLRWTQAAVIKLCWASGTTLASSSSSFCSSATDAGLRGWKENECKAPIQRAAGWAGELLLNKE